MIPVTLLTGFLGAGKTTLLNRLIAACGSERVAVVENEFGAAGIDASLVDPQAATVVELANGCICCSVRGELSAALQDLLQRRARGELAFSRLFIETTGLADPGPVVQTFFWEESLRANFRLDAVITLVDVCHAAAQLDREPVASAQVAYADWLVLSKTDLMAADGLIDRLRTINVRAGLVDVNAPGFDWGALLDTGGFSLNEAGLPARNIWQPANGARGRYGQGLPRRSWDDAISSLLLEHNGAVDIDAISAFVEQLIENHANDLLRYKGILAIAGEARRLIFQGVHRIAGFDYGRDWDGHEVPSSRIVLIGRALPESALRTGFRACFA